MAAEAILDRIHRAADLLAVVIGFAVVDGDEDFGVLGGHADERGHPHPEQGARAADGDRGGDASNVAGADGGASAVINAA